VKDSLKTVAYAEGKGFLSPIDEIIEDLRNGRMVILVDAEDRENEGDLVIPAQMATPDAINFMAKHGRGLICLSLTPVRAAQLRLEFMARQNEARNRTAFTVSIEAREGIATGISAQLSCTSTHTVDNTDVAAVHVGRKLIERAGGWSIDVAGFLGAQRHLEKDYQDDIWSVMAFIKPYFYGFPWDKYVRTRFGWGWGLSYAEQIPLMELRDQASHGRGTWKLLGYSDPSLDFQVARDTFVGVGVSHRSGGFGKSQLFGNVNGGSNYIYFSIETSL